MIKDPYAEYAIKSYLEYVNNFLTIKSFAEHYNLTLEKAIVLIFRGKKMYNKSLTN
jgi:hypothetical protein